MHYSTRPFLCHVALAVLALSVHVSCDPLTKDDPLCSRTSFEDSSLCPRLGLDCAEHLGKSFSEVFVKVCKGVAHEEVFSGNEQSLALG